MITNIYTDVDGNTVEETRETPDGPVTSRTVTSAGGNVTNIAHGAVVGIQTGSIVTNRTIRR